MIKINAEGYGDKQISKEETIYKKKSSMDNMIILALIILAKLIWQKNIELIYENWKHKRQVKYDHKIQMVEEFNNSLAEVTISVEDAITLDELKEDRVMMDKFKKCRYNLSRLLNFYSGSCMDEFLELRDILALFTREMRTCITSSDNIGYLAIRDSLLDRIKSYEVVRSLRNLIS